MTFLRKIPFFFQPTVRHTDFDSKSISFPRVVKKKILCTCWVGRAYSGKSERIFRDIFPLVYYERHDEQQVFTYSAPIASKKNTHIIIIIIIINSFNTPTTIFHYESADDMCVLARCCNTNILSGCRVSFTCLNN